MEFKLVCITFTAIIFLCSSPSAAAPECPQDPIIFNFGDSNSDTGSFAAAYGVVFGYPFGRKFFHRSSDRFSDGRLIIDFLWIKGMLPWMLATIKVEDPRVDFDEAGCLKPLNEVAQEFNAQLHNLLCEDLRAELKNATVVYVDIYVHHQVSPYFQLSPQWF